MFPIEKAAAITLQLHTFNTIIAQATAINCFKWQLLKRWFLLMSTQFFEL